MVELIWPDGSLSKAKTWSEILTRVRRRQWSKYGPWAFRIVLAKRAKIWTGNPVTVLGSDAEFGRRLGRAGLFVVVEDSEEV